MQCIASTRRRDGLHYRECFPSVSVKVAPARPTWEALIVFQARWKDRFGLLQVSKAKKVPYRSNIRCCPRVKVHIDTQIHRVTCSHMILESLTVRPPSLDSNHQVCRRSRRYYIGTSSRYQLHSLPRVALYLGYILPTGMSFFGS